MCGFVFEAGGAEAEGVVLGGWMGGRVLVEDTRAKEKGH